MRRAVLGVIAIIAVAGAVSHMGPASGQSDGEAAPIFGIKIPPGYRDWKLISVAHEAGNLDDLRAILGNDIAIDAYREGRQEFPDGAIIARLAWAYTPSDENNQVFGQRQSYVAGQPKEGGPVHGQGLKKVCRDRRLGICSIQRWQTGRGGSDQNMLPMSCPRKGT